MIALILKVNEKVNKIYCQLVRLIVFYQIYRSLATFLGESYILCYRLWFRLTYTVSITFRFQPIATELLHFYANSGDLYL